MGIAEGFKAIVAGRLGRRSEATTQQSDLLVPPPEAREAWMRISVVAPDYALPDGRVCAKKIADEVLREGCHGFRLGTGDFDTELALVSGGAIKLAYPSDPRFNSNNPGNHVDAMRCLARLKRDGHDQNATAISAIADGLAESLGV